MKLAEALMNRADMQTRLQQLKPRIFQCSSHQEGDEPPEDVEALIRTYIQIQDDLEQLVAKINIANNTVTLEDGTIMARALARRKTLIERQRLYREVAETATQAFNRYAQSEIRTVRAVDVAELQRLASETAKEARQLDIRIQKANWEHDVE